MGLKKVRRVEPPKKEPEEKKVATPKPLVKKKEPVKVADAVPQIPQDIAKPVVVTTVAEKTTKDHNGIGIVGSNGAINTFKGKIKTKGLKVGKVLMELIADWNSKN